MSEGAWDGEALDRWYHTVHVGVTLTKADLDRIVRMRARISYLEERVARLVGDLSFGTAQLKAHTGASTVTEALEASADAADKVERDAWRRIDELEERNARLREVEAALREYLDGPFPDVDCDCDACVYQDAGSVCHRRIAAQDRLRASLAPLVQEECSRCLGTYNHPACPECGGAVSRAQEETDE